MFFFFSNIIEGEVACYMWIFCPVEAPFLRCDIFIENFSLYIISYLFVECDILCVGKLLLRCDIVSFLITSL